MISGLVVGWNFRLVLAKEYLNNNQKIRELA
jgi:hypothetical protein